MLKTNQIQIRDPFVLPVAKEKKYYLYGTTDKSPWGGKATGFDVYIGQDLENWDGPYTVFSNTPDFWAEENFWAPEVHYYKGRFYMLASFKSNGKCRGVQILVSENPAGPFVPHSDGPITPKEWECLDGTMYEDENGDPWMIYCHEWIQVHDGEIRAVRLTHDLKNTDGDQILLFSASEAPWCFANTGCIDLDDESNYVTDGPFLHKTKEGELLMIWSSYTKKGYAIGVAHSVSGKITGPWKQETEPIYSNDGGHGMLFITFEGQLMLAIHTPNQTPDERAIFIPIKERESTLYID